MLGRRGFLQGIVSGLAGAGLIVQATPAEVAQFATGQPVQMSETITPMPDASIGVGEFVFDHRGRIIGIIVDAIASREMIDITSMGDTTFKGLPRPTVIEYRVRTAGVAQVKLGLERFRDPA